ncbi:MAG: hypothetical protein H3C32_09305 [Anaerolineae bacterium]|nr:hypothetical protein [Anaerolineae bacterium]
MTRIDFDILREHEANLRRSADQYRLARIAEGGRTPDLRRDLGTALVRLGAWLEAEPQVNEGSAEEHRQLAS